MAARTCAGRSALVPHSRDPHDGMRKSRAFAKTGAVAGLCPITEASLGDGIFPAREFLDAGGALRCRHRFQRAGRRRRRAAPARIWPAAQAPRAQRAVRRSPARSTGRALFDDALAGGARALAQATVGLGAGCARRHRHARHRASVAGGTHARRRHRRLDFCRQATARSIASGPAATRSSKADGTDCAKTARERFNATVRRLVA